MNGRPSNKIMMVMSTSSVWSKYMKHERQSTIPVRVQAYWRQLSPTERQSVLFLDEADLVKQLYKLNFSLLCVGLMQRRLKKKSNEESIVKEEPTYELLEAMEFMDIGTGIMTVKNELVQDDKVDTLFGLICGNLRGFLVHTHVLSDTEFQQLFFRDSESTSTWDEYQNLVAILLEQLILKSFVAYLERESLRQMEALLLEEDLAHQTQPTKTKKKKKRKKTDNSATIVDNRIPQDTTDIALPQISIQNTTNEPLITQASSANEALITPAPTTDKIQVDTATAMELALPVASISQSNGVSRLNPKAVAFQPINRTTLPLKRKFDSFIVHITPDEDDPEYAASDDEEQEDYERDIELDQHLSAIYHWSASHFRWDFERQQDLSSEWLQPEFFMTQRVVRYFSEPPCSKCMNGFCRFHRYNIAAPPSSYWHQPPVQTYQHHSVFPSPHIVS
ncbi:hypothetical protein THRCLA_11816 [Thraustotheca clavata]|uniref:Uncharacterized protein n=1 Tax=Thraustotheca clavata TaxID=74557 RepID=A0A1V9Y6N9_9STRA|nr:hypothetical protein THRCLA_11816 [Thraustotheca clavata]